MKLKTQLMVVPPGGLLHELPIIRPVHNGNLPDKPYGGGWTSTYLPRGEFASDWIRWCYTEYDEMIEDKGALLLEVKERARLYVIDSYEDLKRLAEQYPWEITGIPYPYLDWERMTEQYDGVHLTPKGERETHHTFPLSFNGWDCESTLWFRNVFSEVKRYTGKLVRK